MSGKKVKVSVLEEDGVEILEPTELLLTAEVIDVDDSSIGSGSDDLQSVLNFIASSSGGGVVGGHSANYVFTPGNVVGGCDANGN